MATEPSRRTRVKMTSKRQITLPVSLCQALGIEKGAELDVTPTPEGVLLRPVPRFQPLSRSGVLFSMAGVGASAEPVPAEEHDRLLAEDAAADDRRV